MAGNTTELTPLLEVTLELIECMDFSDKPVVIYEDLL